MKDMLAIIALGLGIAFVTFLAMVAIVYGWNEAENFVLTWTLGKL
jgi:hypothetical protein